MNAVVAELPGQIFGPMTAPLPMTTAEAYGVVRRLINSMMGFDVEPVAPEGATVRNAEAHIEALKAVLSVMTGASAENLQRAADSDLPKIAAELRATLPHAAEQVRAHIDFVDNWIDCRLADEGQSDGNPVTPYAEFRKELAVD